MNAVLFFTFRWIIQPDRGYPTDSPSETENPSSVKIAVFTLKTDYPCETDNSSSQNRKLKLDKLFAENKTVQFHVKTDYLSGPELPNR